MSGINVYSIVARIAASKPPPTTIQCPCCGTDTGIPFLRPGRPMTKEQSALRERMKRSGMSAKAVRFWTNMRVGRLGW